MRQIVIPIILNNLNPQELKTLDLSSINGIDQNCIQHLLKSESLTEISFSSSFIGHLVDYVVNNLPSNIQKLSLRGLGCVKDKHVKTIVEKYKNLKELEIGGSLDITDTALNNIVENLRQLEKLDVSHTKIGYTELLKVKSLPNLKVLICWSLKNFMDMETREKEVTLKKLLPHLSINPTDLGIVHLDIADPNHNIKPEDGLWDIHVDCVDMFPYTQSFKKHRGI